MDKPVNKTYTPVLSLYEAKKENLIPILLAFQRNFSYLSRDMMQKVAAYVGVPESSVYNIATFYSQFRLEPPGIHQVHVCRGTACHVMGAERLLRNIEKRLGIKAGETTLDNEISLDTINCAGICGLAPTLEVDGKLYTRLNGSSLNRILGKKKR
ncbi:MULTISPECIES: complex I 24 kDa subunit family protein [Dehalococcoides]|uniref:complex I 24 kDa subunit family protein n=1 Tax=Dehalococcoides TaxID=61434 RepID=UPI0002B76C34|nr:MULTISPECIES: NAD(P)H-dependent oxidoreductase subunit E [Dehalococcoides]AGG06085.1 HymA-like iron-sulfur cluster protein [Dehalococcoides mccartyi DCMB5]PKH45052.1 iron hydrogenase [Dehalococcoides mccartyi]BAS31495.1 HymA-like iron-sulfur cluster protein [Dehalococcoides mccartyi IBARAKI]